MRGRLSDVALNETLDRLLKDGLLSEAPGGRMHRPSQLLRDAIGKAREDADTVPGTPVSTPPTDPRELSLLETRAWLSLRQNDLRAALLRADAAREVARRNRSPVREATAALLQGECLRALGQSSQARDALSAALQLAREGKAPAYEAHALAVLARLHTEGGQPDAAYDLANRALKTFRELDDAAGAAIASIELGRVHLTRAEGSRAARTFARGVSFAQLAADVRTQARALNGLGRALQLMGDLEGAIATFDEALELVAADDDLQANLSVAYARVLAEAGKCEDARKALAHARRSGDESLAPSFAAALLVAETFAAGARKESFDQATAALGHARDCGRNDLVAEALLALSAAAGHRDDSVARAAIDAAADSRDRVLELRARAELVRTLRATSDSGSDELGDRRAEAEALLAELAALQGDAKGSFLARPALKF